MRTCIVCMLIVCLMSCREKQKTLAISKIKAVSKLATTEATLSKMIFASEQRRFLGVIKLGEAQFAARTKATVTAGVDLTKIKADDIVIEGNRISVKLPAVEVINFEYPFSSYEIDYTITHDAFAAKIDIKEHEELYRRAESQIREQLPYLGIRETTEQNTTLLLEKILNSLGYEEVYITYGPTKPENFIQPIPLTDEDFQ
ncbi:DUF4230 domain-containing protein [Chryseosolibacter histidini]|nr:DUF4230 domain-containing protein [Chryseosolibacter histidini]